MTVLEVKKEIDKNKVKVEHASILFSKDIEGFWHWYVPMFYNNAFLSGCAIKSTNSFKYKSDCKRDLILAFNSLNIPLNFPKKEINKSRKSFSKKDMEEFE
jgi:hypothetical protein